LLWKIAFARERHQLISENRRLRQAQRHQLQLEHEEANRLLRQQRDMLSDLETLCAAPTPPHTDSPEPLDLPEVLVGHYRELLRAYVIMGSGNLNGDMQELAELLVGTGTTPQQTMLLHLQVLEELVRGLGSRSARHVMTRADLLVLEIMIHLADGYRQGLLERLHPPQQLLLPGFDGSG
jgi:hypothetical protein